MRKNILILVLSLSLMVVSIVAYQKHKDVKYFREQAIKLKADAERSALLAERLQEQAEMQVKQAELAMKEAEQSRQRAEQLLKEQIPGK